MFRDDTICRAGGNVAKLRILLLIAYLFPIQTFAQENEGGPEAAEPLVAIATRISGIVTANAVHFAQYSAPLEAGAATLQTAAGSCDGKKKIADTMCLEQLSPEILKFTAENGELVNMALMMGGSLGDQCKGLGNALSKASMVLGAYQAACATGQAMCTSSCTSVNAAATKLKTEVLYAFHQVNTACSGVTSPDCANRIIAVKTAMTQINSELAVISGMTGKKLAVCGKYKISIATAVMGGISAIKGAMQAKSCANKNQEENPVADQNCTNDKSPNYQTPGCQCARGEKTAAECQAININGSNLNAGGIALPKPSGAGKDGAKGGPMELGGDDDRNLGKIGPSASGASPPTGGGGGGAGGGSGGSGAGQDGANAPKRLNTNILGGGFGGGGGGGSGGGGPGYGEMDSKLKDYMPGQKNDPNRTLASQLAKEVTPQAGRSNWEKVRLRYRDNYSSLLNK